MVRLEVGGKPRAEGLRPVLPGLMPLWELAWAGRACHPDLWSAGVQGSGCGGGLYPSAKGGHALSSEARDRGAGLRQGFRGLGKTWHLRGFGVPMAAADRGRDRKMTFVGRAGAQLTGLWGHGLSWQ